MMRVALDFSAGVAQPAGIGRYVRELARELADLLGRDLVLWYGRTPSHPAGTPPPTATPAPFHCQKPISCVSGIAFVFHCPLTSSRVRLTLCMALTFLCPQLACRAS